MQFSQNTVDWAPFAAAWAASDGELDLDDQPFIHDVEPDLGDSVVMEQFVAEAFTEMRPRLPAAQARGLERFLRWFCFDLQSEDGAYLFEPARDITFTDHVTLFSAMSPERVEQALADARAIDLAGVDALAGAALSELSHFARDDIASEEWREYVEGWRSIFERTAARGRGLLYHVC